MNTARLFKKKVWLAVHHYAINAIKFGLGIGLKN